VDLDSLLGPDGLGGEAGGAWPLDPEACRRLACDGAVTRVLVTRHPTNDHPGGDDNLVAQLRVAATRLPPALGGAPTQPLEVGRTSRVVSAAQRAALVVRDGGWRLGRDPDGRLAATAPYRRPQRAPAA